MTISKKLIGAGATALGAIIVFIASFLKFYSLKMDGDSEKMNLKDLSKAAKDIEKSTFNPHALLIIFAILGIIAACAVFIMPKLDKLFAIVACASGLAVLITIIVYGNSGALGDVKEYAEAIGKLARAFGSDDSIKSSFGAGYVLTIIGSIIMMLGAIFTFICDFIFPDNTPAQPAQW